MKKLIVGFVFILSTTAFTDINARTNVTFEFFYSSLSPYGEWIELDYDFYVWKPYHVRSSWQPYTHGRWIWSSYGWYWDSYEPFGWATFHYGRWYFDNFYGWVWIPGDEWGPAWVEWRYNDNYIGWAPLPPYAVFDIGLGIHFSINWVAPHHYWNFVVYDRFCHSSVNYYIVDHSTNINIYNRTKYRTNYNYRNGRIYNGGVDRGYVERRGGYRLAEREIVSTSNTNSYKHRNLSDDGRIEVYKPSLDEVTRTTSVDRSVIKKSNRKTSLQVDKVVSSHERPARSNEEVKVRTESNTGNTRKYNNELKYDESRTSNKPVLKKNESSTSRSVTKSKPKDEKTYKRNSTSRTKNSNTGNYKSEKNSQLKQNNKSTKKNESVTVKKKTVQNPTTKRKESTSKSSKSKNTKSKSRK